MGTARAAGTRIADRYGFSTMLAALSSPETSPAAGSAAAAAAAGAAAVVSKVANRGGDEGLTAQADALARRLIELAADDADAYERARRALREPRTETPAGDFGLGAALHDAAFVPLRIAEAAADVTLIAREAALASPELVADAAGAAVVAAGGARAATHLVRVNLGALPGDERLARAEAAAEQAGLVAAELEARGGAG